MTDATNAERFYVAAVQDWGGSQEHWKTWPAKDHAEAQDIAWLCERANSTDPFDCDAEYASDNVAPGWEAIFIVPCAHEDCHEWEDERSFYRYVRHLRAEQAWWTPSGDYDEETAA